MSSSLRMILSFSINCFTHLSIVVFVLLVYEVLSSSIVVPVFSPFILPIYFSAIFLFLFLVYYLCNVYYSHKILKLINLSMFMSSIFVMKR